MAVDTENKRRSAPNVYLYTTNPVPDGTIGAADRMQVAGYYSGIAAGEEEVSYQTVFGFENNIFSTVFSGAVVR